MDTFERVLHVTSMPHVPLPPKEGSIGPVTAEWEDIGDGKCLIRCTGGTPADRVLARDLLRMDLAHHNLTVAKIDPTVDHRTADMIEPDAWTPMLDRKPRQVHDDYTQDWSQLSHGTAADNIPSILAHGIVPWDAGGPSTTHWYDHLTPRPGHTYFTRDPHHAWSVAGGKGGKAVVHIDPRHLDPQNINPDEDDFKVMWDPGAWRGLEAEKADFGGLHGETANKLKDPRTRALAYRGHVPPQAIIGHSFYTGLSEDIGHDGTPGWQHHPNPAYTPVAQHFGSFEKTAHWNDIMEKAKRLKDSGQVQIGGNSRNMVNATVVGDHGTYSCEFSRDDPDSWAITGWQCECPWDQYAWGRTRKWKKYEGRVCSHVLAAFWFARAHSLDEDLSPGGGMPGGMKGPSPEAQGQGQLFNPTPLDLAAQQDTGGDAPAGAATGPAVDPSAPPDAVSAPASPDAGVIPPQPMLPGMEPAPPPPYQPGTAPSGTTAPPDAVSVPGARMPTPQNPLQQQFVFSAETLPRQKRTWEFLKTPEAHRDYLQEFPEVRDEPPKSEVVHQYPDGWTVQYHHNPQAVTSVGKFMRNCWQGLSPSTISNTQQLRGDGKRRAFAALHDEHGLPRVAFWHFNDGAITAPWGHHNKEPYHDEMARLNQFGDASGYVSRPRTRTAKAKDWDNGMMVRLDDPTFGIMEGPSEAHGAGRYREIPAGSIGEVLSAQDVPVLGTLVDCIFAGPCKNNGPHEPYHVRAHIEEKHLTVAGWVKAPGPFTQRT